MRRSSVSSPADELDYGKLPLHRTGQAEAFDAIGNRYDEAFPHEQGQIAAIEWLIMFLPADSRVLDLGCGVRRDDRARPRAGARPGVPRDSDVLTGVEQLCTRLRKLAAKTTPPALEELCDDALGALGGGDRDDDIALLDAAARRPLSSSRTASTTCAPCRASSRAVARPRPLLAPVTTTVRPFRSGILSAVHLLPATIPRLPLMTQ
jgi:hypothetical protein